MNLAFKSSKSIEKLFYVSRTSKSFDYSKNNWFWTFFHLPTHWACSYYRSFCLNDFLPSFWIWRFIFDYNHIIMCLTSEIRIVKFSIGKSNTRLVGYTFAPLICASLTEEHHLLQVHQVISPGDLWDYEQPCQHDHQARHLLMPMTER